MAKTKDTDQTDDLFSLADLGGDSVSSKPETPPTQKPVRTQVTKTIQSKTEPMKPIAAVTPTVATPHPMPIPEPPKPIVYSVAGLTALIRDTLEGKFRHVIVEGEISNLSRPTSGHLYFSLKDEAALIRVTFFKGAQASSRSAIALLKDGQKFRVTGSVSVYAPQGSYQLNAKHIEPLNTKGDLLERFEILKRKLFAEGVCEAALKKPLPLLPQRLGIVTAPTGAVIHDMLSILDRRFQNLHIILAPVRVQGAGAAEEIVEAIELLNRYHGPGSAEPLDAMIVGRGGGSLEDLWCFNEECVARAVIASKIPVISAVGHEPDVAITDFVADVRAATPSAAVELLCGRREDFDAALLQTRSHLAQTMDVAIRTARDRITAIKKTALFRDPLYLVNIKSQQTDNRAARLQAALLARIAQTKDTFAQLQMALRQSQAHLLPTLTAKASERQQQIAFTMTRRLEQEKQRIAGFASRLNDLSPFTVLSRGYTLTTVNGQVVRSAHAVHDGDTLTTRFADGEVVSRVSND